MSGVSVTFNQNNFDQYIIKKNNHDLLIYAS